MSGLLANWKTSLIGVAAGAMVAFATSYQSGMTWKQWAAGGLVAVMGILSRDFNVTSQASGAK